MFRFPASVFNERIGVFVDSFYDEMRRLYDAQGWTWQEPVHAPGKWQHPDFDVRIARRFGDRAARTLEWKAHNLPGVAAVSAAGRVTVRNEQRFRIDVPRSYPSNLGAIVVRCMLALYHPRIGPSGRGAACLYVNGEVDRVLLSIVRQVLLDPDYVQPPSLFRGQDRGTNLEAMNWYETGPQRIHARLLDLWAEAHGARRFVAPGKKHRGVTVGGQ